MDSKGLIILVIVAFGLEFLQMWKSRQERKQNEKLITTLVDANRHLALATKAKDAIEAQTAIERDVAAHKEEELGPTPEPVPEKPLNRRFTANGHRFSVYGYDDAEREFVQNVIEGKDAVPVAKS